MTNEQAINILKNIDLTFVYKQSSYEARDMAIEALKRDDPEVEFQKRFERSRLCGYTAKELLMFADACRRQGITEAEMRAFCNNSESALNYMIEKMYEQMEKKY